MYELQAQQEPSGHWYAIGYFPQEYEAIRTMQGRGGYRRRTVKYRIVFNPTIDYRSESYFT